MSWSRGAIQPDGINPSPRITVQNLPHTSDSAVFNALSSPRPDPLELYVLEEFQLQFCGKVSPNSLVLNSTRLDASPAVNRDRQPRTSRVGDRMSNFLALWNRIAAALKNTPRQSPT